MREEILTIRDVWLAGYRQRLAEERAAGRLEMLPEGDERRRFPRVRVTGGNVAAEELGPVEVLNLSASGLAMASPVPFAVDQPLTVSLANVFSTETRVVRCEPLAAPAGDKPAGAPQLYVVRGQFADADHGLQFVTLALELDRLERE